MIHIGAKDPVEIGDFCSITHRVVVHGAKIGDNCLIGIGAILMDGAEVGEGSIVAGGAFIPENKPFPPEMAGFQKQFTEGARSWGPYARGPAAIAAMWNQTSRSFGAAFIGEKTSLEAAEELLAFVESQL